MGVSWIWTPYGQHTKKHGTYPSHHTDTIRTPYGHHTPPYGNHVKQPRWRAFNFYLCTTNPAFISTTRAIADQPTPTSTANAIYSAISATDQSAQLPLLGASLPRHQPDTEPAYGSGLLTHVDTSAGAPRARHRLDAHVRPRQDKQY